MIGTIEEAQAIYQVVSARHWDFDNCPSLPDGWDHLGTGGTRQAYLSPSGVVYKICHDYDPDEPSHNDREAENFKAIKHSGRLPKGWKVPESHLHAFETNLKRFDYKSKQPYEDRARVSVLACDYVAGMQMSAWDEVPEDDWNAMQQAFAQVGLRDTDGANAVKSHDGYYIIDAGEDMLTGDN